MANKTHKENFLTSIIKAGNHAATGNRMSMNKYISEARSHQKNHVAEHHSKYGSESAHEENVRLNDFYSKIKDIWEGKDVFKSESSVGRYGMRLAKPSKNSNYSYKHFNDLTPDQKVAAKQKFEGAPDIEKYHYPLNQDGSVAHASRWLDPTPTASNASNPSMKPSNTIASSAPEAGAPKSDLSTHHKRDSAVRIVSQGHEHDGKVGVVQAPNPYYPDKVHVKINEKGGKQTSIFVKPQEAYPSKSSPVSKSETVVDLSKYVLEKIKKRG